MKDDIISRQAAIDALTENKKMINAVLDSLTLDYNARKNQEQRRGQINEDIETIKTLPLIEFKRNKGQWIVDEKRFGGTERHCSLCGAILEGDDWKWRNNNYCYHCGAKMVTE